MTVAELIALLKTHDPKAIVAIDRGSECLELLDEDFETHNVDEGATIETADGTKFNDVSVVHITTWD